MVKTGQNNEFLLKNCLEPGVFSGHKSGLTDFGADFLNLIFVSDLKTSVLVSLVFVVFCVSYYIAKGKVQNEKMRK